MQLTKEAGLLTATPHNHFRRRIGVPDVYKSRQFSLSATGLNSRIRMRRSVETPWPTAPAGREQRQGDDQPLKGYQFVGGPAAVRTGSGVPGDALTPQRARYAVPAPQRGGQMWAPGTGFQRGDE